MISETGQASDAIDLQDAAQRTAWVALDVNQHDIRLVMLVDGSVRGVLEARCGPRQVLRIIRFIQDTLPPDTRARLAGRFYDQWDPMLSSALVTQFGPVTWINPTLLCATRSEVDRWSRIFRTHRALLYAVCAQEGESRDLHPLFDQYDLVCAWKNTLLHTFNEQFNRM